MFDRFDRSDASTASRGLRRLTAPALVAAALLPFVAIAFPARADLPPLTPADWSAKPPAADAHASTLVLYKRAEFQLMDLARQEHSSTLREELRLKVLDQRGLESGELEVPHSRYLRLKSLTGRTVLPGGRVLPLSADAKFERRLSKNEKIWVTAVAFPGVQVGAILELEATFFFDSIYMLEPWSLSDSAPVLYSEVVFNLPRSLQARTWGRDPFRAGVETAKTDTPRGTQMRAWARNLPSTPDEAFGPPLADLTTQFGVVTTAFSGSSMLMRLMETWQTTVTLFEENDYAAARRKARNAEKKARQLAASATDPRAKAEALYLFVRDEVRNDEAPGVGLEEGSTVDKVLAEGSGDSAEKALLLQAMLGAVDVPAKLVWASERSTGLVMLDIPSPAWFERVIVAAELPEGRTYLDPAQPGLPFGSLAAELEGGDALIADPKKPEPVKLPSSPAADNRRRVTMKLAVDDEGQLSGTGELVLAGHPAVSALDDKEPLEKTWQKWLEERFPGFRVEGLAVAPSKGAGPAEVKLQWKLAARAEEVLGDEVTVALSRPLGPLTQPLTLEPTVRRTPVVLPYLSSDEVDYEVAYPAGWSVHAEPAGSIIANEAGELRVDVDVDAAARKVRYRRQLDLLLRETPNPATYSQLRSLFAAVERSDAKTLALARD